MYYWYKGKHFINYEFLFFILNCNFQHQLFDLIFLIPHSLTNQPITPWKSTIPPRWKTQNYPSPIPLGWSYLCFALWKSSDEYTLEAENSYACFALGFCREISCWIIESICLKLVSFLKSNFQEWDCRMFCFNQWIRN